MKTGTGQSRWIVLDGKQGSMRLFCIPYAGGGPSVFRTWSMHVPAHVEVCAVHFPGRETRINEPAIDDWMCLVRELSDAIAPYLDRPYALFGHSLGGLICFELAREVRRRFDVEPIHLFVSGSAAPQLPDTDPMSDLPEAEFLDRVREMKGTPPEVMRHPELRTLIVPILRADFSLRDTYQYRVESPLACPISAFGGMHDDGVGYDELEGWHEHTSARFQVRLFQGDHFFLRTAQAAVLEAVTEALTSPQEFAGATEARAIKCMRRSTG